MASTEPVCFARQNKAEYEVRNSPASQEGSDTSHSTLTIPININIPNKREEVNHDLPSSQGSDDTFHSFNSENTDYHDCLEAHSPVGESARPQEDIAFDAWLDETEEYVDEGIDAWLESEDHDEGIHIDDDEWADLDEHPHADNLHYDLLSDEYVPNDEPIPTDDEWADLDEHPHFQYDIDLDEYIPLPPHLQQDLDHLTTMALSAQQARYGSLLTPVETRDSDVSYFQLEGDNRQTAKEAKSDVVAKKPGKIFCGRHGFSCRICNRKR